MFLSLIVGDPKVISLLFDFEATHHYTLTCTSTGSPATNVTWMKDGDTLTVGGRTNQRVTNRSTSTYESVLYVMDSLSNIISHTYTCMVQNQLGADSMDITVNGETCHMCFVQV